MLLRKESLEKSDVCRDFLAYVTAGPRTCLNHLYRSFSKNVYDAGKFQPFLILATLTPPTPHSLLATLTPPHPSLLTRSAHTPHPSLLTRHPHTPHPSLLTRSPHTPHPSLLTHHPYTPHPSLLTRHPHTPHPSLLTRSPHTPHPSLLTRHPYTPHPSLLTRHPHTPPHPSFLTRSPHPPPPPTPLAHSLLAALTLHSLLTALQERKWNGRLVFYCRTATVPWFCTSIVLVIDRSSHFLCLLPRETPCSSGANNHTVPYPPKAVLWAIGTVSAENVFDVEMNKVAKFIVFHRVNNHLFRCTNRTEYETALTRRFKTHHVPPYELVQAD